MEIKPRTRWLNSFMTLGFKAADTLTILWRLVPRILVVGMLCGWVISHLALPSNAILHEIVNRPYISSVALVFIVLAFDALVIYPRIRDPLRTLPNTTVRSP